MTSTRTAPRGFGYTGTALPPLRLEFDVTALHLAAADPVCAALTEAYPPADGHYWQADRTCVVFWNDSGVGLRWRVTDRLYLWMHDRLHGKPVTARRFRLSGGRPQGQPALDALTT